MARKYQLRVQRAGTVINVTSKQQESDVIKALVQVVDYLGGKFKKKISIVHEKQWRLKDIVAELRHTYPEIEFHSKIAGCRTPWGAEEGAHAHDVARPRRFCGRSSARQQQAEPGSTRCRTL